MEEKLKRMTPLFAAMLLLTAGCQSMTYDISPAQGTAAGSHRATEARHFENKSTAHYLFWGLVPVSTPDINELARKQAAADDVLTNISIKEQNTFVDGLLALVTYGIYRPRTVWVSGDIVGKEVVQ